MSYDNLSSVSQNVLKFYWQPTGEERRIPFIFDDFRFCSSRVIELDITENRIFTRCRMITWVVFLRMFWNFISSLPVKRGGSLSFLVGTISNVLVMDVGSGGYILVSCAHSSNSCCWFKVLIFFQTNRDLENPPPGTVVDHDITRRDWYDLLIVIMFMNLSRTMNYNTH
jgi:hypothetical protein